MFAEAEFESEETRTTGGAKTDEKSRLFEEGIDLVLAGFIYDPNLVDWDASLGFTLTQETTEVGGRETGSDGTLENFSISAMILGEKPVSVRLFSSSNESLLDRDFAQRTELQTERQGIQFFTKGSFPASLTFETLEVNEESEQRMNDTETDLVRFEISDRRDPDWLTEFDYEHEETDETASFLASGGTQTVTELPEDRDEASLSNAWRFGEQPWEANLAGRFRYMSQGGFFPQKTLSADQNLDLVHSDTLSSFYRLAFNDNQTEAQDDRTVSAEAGVTKSIYDSLDITATGSYVDSDFTTGSSTTHGTNLRMLYRKSTALGLLRSSLGLGRLWEDEASSTGARLIQDEPVTLVGFDFFPLSEIRVVPGSLVVTNLSETTLYLESIDSFVQTTGAITEISRRAGGGIADGQTVLVNYVVSVATDASFATRMFDFAASMELDDLPVTVYYERAEREDELDSGVDPGNLEDETRNLIGVEVVIGNLKASAEHEDHDRKLSPPTVSDSVRLDYRRRVGRDLSLNLNGFAETIDLKDAEEFGLEPGDDHQETYAAGLGLTARLRRNLLLSVNANALRNEGREDRESFGLGVSLDGRYRDLEFFVEVRHDRIEQERNETEQSLLRFRVSRRF